MVVITSGAIVECVDAAYDAWVAGSGKNRRDRPAKNDPKIRKWLEQFVWATVRSLERNRLVMTDTADYTEIEKRMLAHYDSSKIRLEPDASYRQRLIEAIGSSYTLEIASGKDLDYVGNLYRIQRRTVVGGVIVTPPTPLKVGDIVDCEIDKSGGIVVHNPPAGFSVSDMIRHYATYPGYDPGTETTAPKGPPAREPERFDKRAAGDRWSHWRPK